MLAASITGEPRRLALALYELDRFSSERSDSPIPTLAQAAHGGHLMSRIQSLLRTERRVSPGAAAILLFYGASGLWLWAGAPRRMRQAAGLIAPTADRNESVLLGEDLEPQIPGMCIVSDRYLVGGGLWGSIALIGPTRMPFQKLMPLLHEFADQLGEGMSGKRKDTPQAAVPRRTVIYKEDLE